MSLDCPLLKPTCKKSLICGNKPYKKPECPLTGLVPKCPLTPPPCPLSPPKCPLTPDPCPLSCPPPKCPMTCPPPPSPCPLAPPKCPLSPPKCPLTPEPCPLTCPPPPSPCPLAPPKCPLSPPKCPLTPEPCPLTCPPPPSPCPLAPPKCPLTPQPCPLSPPKCPLTCPPPPPSCPLTCPPPPPPCPLTCPPPPSPCPLAPPKCPLTPQPCPLAPPKCPLTPDPCPLAPPKCPLTPQPCPLTVPPKPQCPLLPPKCPLFPPKCPLQTNPDPCPLDKPYDINSPCVHTQFLNKSLNRRPLSFPLPPSVCHEVARKCPFEPVPMICHELCPCSEVPEVDAGPWCPFLPPDPVCPPMCPLEKQPNCPLIQKPDCMWKPQAPAPCPISAPSDTYQAASPGGCALNSFDICPSFFSVPGKPKKAEPRAKTKNIECCPFCDDKPVVKCEPPKSKSFHFPSCPMFKPPCQLQALPTNVPSCPFYPCPCPLTGCCECPIKVPPLQIPFGNNSQEIVSLSSSKCSGRSLSSCPSQPSVCPPNNFPCSVPAPDCPLANFKCTPCPPPPPPPCPVKGCLKKSSCSGSGGCPAKTEGCSLFPEGRCPMEDLKTCDCDYPVPPCMIDPNREVKPPPPQYCIKDNCCMGLPDPPIVPTPLTGDTYYSFMALNPANESTKYYIDIADKPPDDLEHEVPLKTPLRPKCSIIKSGEGFKQCKTVKNILEKRGPCQDSGSQYDIKDCPMDEMTKRIKMSLKKKKK